MTVYRGYDRQALDAQYNNRARVPDFAQYLARWKRDSAAARARLVGASAKLDVAYGPSAGQRLDIFPAAPGPGGRKPPVLAFFHGGYWRSLDKGDFSYPALPYVGVGVSYVSVNYDLTPAVTLDEIVHQARAAMAWLYHNSAIHGGDPDRLYVSGHSAGGHLAPMVACTDWAVQGVPADLIKGSVAISGIFDLKPISLCYLDEGMGLNADSVARNSPIHQIPPRERQISPLILCVGGDESPEFLRQQADFARAWAKTQAPARVVDAPGLNHFSVMDAFANPTSALFRACRMLLAP
ncbi:MAG: alpha/beta hydrolase [Rhodospirillales bacterium]